MTERVSKRVLHRRENWKKASHKYYLKQKALREKKGKVKKTKSKK